MSQNDWQPLNQSLTEDYVLRGVTAGVARPNGGGSFAYGMRSIAVQTGLVGFHAKQTGFAPTTKGGRITGALMRSSLGGNDGFSPFLFFCASDATVNANGYLLGISSESASRIQLRKGSLVQGLRAIQLVDPDAAPNVLMQSTDTFPSDVWHHLRLDVIVQGTGDVVLQVFRNDLAVNTVAVPIWQAIPGMTGPNTQFAGFVDDELGVNSGSTPLTAGYMGFAARFETANRACFFDHLSLDHQS